MSKIDAREEKRLRNEEHAKRFKSKKTGRQKSRFLNWCRTPGHPASCRCVYPVL